MYKQLTSEQRYTISVLLSKGMKKKEIAKAIEWLIPPSQGSCIAIQANVEYIMGNISKTS